MKVIIIDDEKLARDLVRNFLQSFENIEVIENVKMDLKELNR